MVRTGLLKIDNWLAKLSEVLLWIVGVPFFTMLIVEVLMRKLANHSLFGVYELTGFLATWISMMGAYLAYRNKEMARLTFILNKLTPWWQFRVWVINKILVLLALIFLGVSGVLFVLNPAVATQQSVSFNIPIIYAYIGIPLGIFLMAFETLLQLLVKTNNLNDYQEEALE